MSSRRAGFSLMELLVAVCLAGLLVGAAGSLLAGQVTAVDAARRLADRLDVVRSARTILVEELRAGVPGRDRAGPAGDSVVMRVYRGVALGCGDAPAAELGPHEVLVHHLGPRLADPGKDSLLVLGDDGGWRAVALASREAAAGTGAPCPGQGGEWRRERWTIPGLAEPLRVARVFERGSYHLSGGALRYRTGTGGRQPLTPALLDDGISGIEPDPETGAVRLRLGFAPAAGAARRMRGTRGWSVGIWPAP